MVTETHSPEPWRVVDDFVCFGPKDEAGRDSVAASTFLPEDARRIVAAVNACAGLPTAALEAGKLGEALALFVEALVDREHAADVAKNGDREPDCLACRANEIAQALRVMP